MPGVNNALDSDRPAGVADPIVRIPLLDDGDG